MLSRSNDPPAPGPGGETARLRDLLERHGLPGTLVVSEVESFRHDSESGELVVRFVAEFRWTLDDRNVLSFDRTVTGRLSEGSLEGLTGIRKGSADVAEVVRRPSGTLVVTGRLGPFSKSHEFTADRIPPRS